MGGFIEELKTAPKPSAGSGAGKSAEAPGETGASPAKKKATAKKATKKTATKKKASKKSSKKKATAKKATKKKASKKASKKSSKKTTSAKTIKAPKRRSVAKGEDGAVAAAQYFAAMSEKYPDRQDLEVISSGHPSFDRVMSGGFPMGKYVELRSDSGLGKSTAVLAIAAYFCERGYGVLHLDTEFAATYSLIHGVGLAPYKGTRYFPHQVATFEQAEEVLATYVPFEGADRGIRLVIMDSVTALIPAALYERSVTSVHPGEKSRLQGDFLLKYRALAATRGFTFAFINQMRTKFKTGRGGKFEAEEDSSGSKAFKYFADIRLDLKRIQFLYKDGKKKGDKIGLEVYLKAFKSRMGLPERRARVSILYGKGFDLTSDYIHYLTMAKVLELKGAFYNLEVEEGEFEKFHGAEKLAEWVDDNHDKCWQILDEVGFFSQ